MRVLLVSLLLLAPLLPTAAADTPECPPKTVTIGEHEKHTFAVHEDCTVDVVLNEGIICLGGNVGKAEYEVGPVHVTSYHCTWGPTPLIPDIAYQPPKHYDVFVPEFMGCTWTGSYKPVVQTPVVTVWVFTCDPPT